MLDNRQILLMLSVGRDIGLCSAGGTGDPDEGDANATVRGRGGMCIHFHACWCVLFASACTCVSTGAGVLV